MTSALSPDASRGPLANARVLVAVGCGVADARSRPGELANSLLDASRQRRVVVALQPHRRPERDAHAARTASAAVGGSLNSREFNMDAYIPLSTQQARMGDLNVQERPGSFLAEVVELTQITLTVNDISEVDVTARIIERLLKKYHEQEDYAVVIPVELLRQAEQQIATPGSASASSR